MDKKIYTALMIIAIIILIINIILTTMEAIEHYHLIYHSGRMRGACGAHKGASEALDPGPDGRIKIAGMWYNVKWIIKGKEGIIYEDKEK